MVPKRSPTRRSKSAGLRQPPQRLARRRPGIGLGRRQAIQHRMGSGVPGENTELIASSWVFARCQKQQAQEGDYSHVQVRSSDRSDRWLHPPRFRGKGFLHRSRPWQEMYGRRDSPERNWNHCHESRKERLRHARRGRPGYGSGLQVALPQIAQAGGRRLRSAPFIRALSRER